MAPETGLYLHRTKSSEFPKAPLKLCIFGETVEVVFISLLVNHGRGGYRGIFGGAVSNGSGVRSRKSAVFLKPPFLGLECQS